MLRRIFSGAFLLSIAALLLLYPSQSLDAGREGIKLCLDLIIPSLFPFFVLSSLFVGLGLPALLGRFFSPLFSCLFHLEGSSASPLILGLIGGYPLGIRTACELYRSNQCSRETFLRLVRFCNNCGPAFLFTVTGVGIFGSKQAGILLLSTHWASAILLGILGRGHGHTASNERITTTVAHTPPFSTAFPESVKGAFGSTLNVCAFVIIFTVLIRLGQVSGLLTHIAQALSSLLPEAVTPALCQSALIGIVELSTGVYSLAESHLSPLALPLAAFILGWGGISVHCQSLPYLNAYPASRKPYFLGKLSHGLLAAALTALLMPFVPFSLTNTAVEAGLWLLPKISLLRREMLLIWLIAGIASLFSKKKDWKNRRQ